MPAIKNIKVAISSEFMTAFAAVPKKMQGKVLEFITKFRNNPMSSSINYEKSVSYLNCGKHEGHSLFPKK
ncbi:hypothetical protein MHK_009459 [Candidatus Magnetomorum sp. HK-1]|nr:hypothetical protein MHK_009459 [Candidatus Magnetomorum sp. HK-1]